MKSQDMILGVMRAQGTADALSLRGRAADMDGTAIIAEEDKVPAFDPAKDYSQWPAGAPVRDGEQVYKLITPHNAAHYPDSRPSSTPALWSITHTKDPAKAKPWMSPSGTSGLYAKGECCTDPEAADPAAVYRSKVDKQRIFPQRLPQNWELVE